MHYYKRHIGDYAKKAGHFSPLEHGIYIMIVDGYYDREQAPTLLEATRWARARTEEEKSAVLAVLDELFQLKDDRYHLEDVDAAIDAYRAQAETNRAIAVTREEKKRARMANESSTNRASVVHESITIPPPNHKPLTSNQEPETKNQKKAEAKAPATGTRLPTDWRPSDADIEYCKTERPDLRPSLVATNFYDYWIAVPGSKGRKADWSATWRTWVRKESMVTAGRTSAPPRGGGQDLDEQRRRNTEEAMRLLGIADHDEGMTINEQ